VKVDIADRCSTPGTGLAASYRVHVGPGAEAQASLGEVLWCRRDHRVGHFCVLTAPHVPWRFVPGGRHSVPSSRCTIELTRAGRIDFAHISADSTLSEPSRRIVY